MKKISSVRKPDFLTAADPNVAKPDDGAIVVILQAAVAFPVMHDHPAFEIAIVESKCSSAAGTGASGDESDRKKQNPGLHEQGG